MNKIRNIGKSEYLFFICSLLIFAFANIFAIWKGIPFVNLSPLALLFVGISLYNYSFVFYCLLASLPLSLDFSFGSLSLSAPSEPLLILSTGLWLVLLLNNRAELKAYLKNPLVIILLLQLVLFTVNIFISIEPVLSLKYLLAKVWFFGGFIFVPLLVLKQEKNYKIAFWCFFIPLMLTVFYAIINHALTGFSFETVNESARPFYVNHVIYACTLGLALPFSVAAYGWYKHNPIIRIILISSILILLFAIITSYTRTTWLSVLAGLFSILVFKSRFLKISFVISLVGITVFCYKLVDDNYYMKYAPKYSSTVFNREDLGKHLEATVELSDVSGMERVYRWVAAVNLIKDNFWLGTGNNTFYPTYKTYVNPAFVTYLSHNPERSSTHNYFLLIFCDQGVFGFILFVILYIWAMLRTKTIYLKSADRFTRNLMIACFSTLVIFLIHLILGDMVEVDKNGGIFLLVLAIIISMDVKLNSERMVFNSSDQKHL